MVVVCAWGSSGDSARARVFTDSAADSAADLVVGKIPSRLNAYSS
jgi:hypothetical protein